MTSAQQAVATSSVRADQLPGVRIMTNCCFGVGVQPPEGHHWVKPFRKKHVHLVRAEQAETICGVPVDGSSRWALAPTYLSVCRSCAERYTQLGIL